MWQIVLEGMGVGVALAAPIGPINIEIVRRGLSGGFRHGWLVGCGAVTADTIYCTAVVSGLAPLAGSSTLRAPLLLAGAIVLSYLGVVGLRATRRGEHLPAHPPSARRSYATGFIMAIANPFGIIYWLSIGAALVASAVGRAGASAAPLLIGGVFAGILCWVTFLSGLTRAGRRILSTQGMLWLSGAGAVGLIGFGLYFGIAGLRTLVGR
jgi:threonine/homoserine/homoserine lactone efflux protein